MSRWEIFNNGQLCLFVVSDWALWIRSWYDKLGVFWWLLRWSLWRIHGYDITNV
jgi:hypothetical protein